MSDLVNRRGTIIVNGDLLMERPMQIEKYKLLFSNFYPYVMIPDDYRNCWAYLGYSEHFDVLEDGDAVPEYLVTISLEQNTIKFKRVI